MRIYDTVSENSDDDIKYWNNVLETLEMIQKQVPVPQFKTNTAKSKKLI